MRQLERSSAGQGDDLVVREPRLAPGTIARACSLDQLEGDEGVALHLEELVRLDEIGVPGGRGPRLISAVMP